jgi:hypothetical protein
MPCFRRCLAITIRDPAKFMEGFWDWGFLDDTLPGKVKVSDIDGFVEKNGHFLILETKKFDVSIPLGQKIAYEKLQKTGLFTIVYLWGEKGFIEEMQVLYANGKVSPKKSADNDDFKRVVEWWVKQSAA